MKVSIRQLKLLIKEAFEGRPDVGKHAKEREEYLTALDRAYTKPINTPGAAFEDRFENEIEDLREQPEFRNVESFVQYLMDDDRDSFSVTELHAVARNVFDVDVAGLTQIKTIRKELEDYGLKFVPRERLKVARGHKSSSHGTHPFAGSGGGGSGFSSGGLGMGGGPGAIGGKTPWSAVDARSLGMGSRRR